MWGSREGCCPPFRTSDPGWSSSASSRPLALSSSLFLPPIVQLTARSGLREAPCHPESLPLAPPAESRVPQTKRTLSVSPALDRSPPQGTRPQQASPPLLSSQSKNGPQGAEGPTPNWEGQLSPTASTFARLASLPLDDLGLHKSLPSKPAPVQAKRQVTAPFMSSARMRHQRQKEAAPRTAATVHVYRTHGSGGQSQPWLFPAIPSKVFQKIRRSDLMKGHVLK